MVTKPGLVGPEYRDIVATQPAVRGWYPDPEIEPLQSRCGMGSSRSDQTRKSRNYGFAKPVRNEKGRFWNRLVAALALVPIFLGSTLLVQHFSRPSGDPTTVNVADLGLLENPKVVIARQCPGSVLSVVHFQGYTTWPNQEWSVVPVQGHVAVAYFNVDTGHVTCP